MFEPLIICSKPNTKRRDFICGIWVDVPTEAVYVGFIEAKEPTEMMIDTLAIAHKNRFQCNRRIGNLEVCASVALQIKLARQMIAGGYSPNKYFEEARRLLNVMNRGHAKLERLP